MGVDGGPVRPAGTRGRNLAAGKGNSGACGGLTGPFGASHSAEQFPATHAIQELCGDLPEQDCVFSRLVQFVQQMARHGLLATGGLIDPIDQNVGVNRVHEVDLE